MHGDYSAICNCPSLSNQRLFRHFSYTSLHFLTNATRRFGRSVKMAPKTAEKRRSLFQQYNCVCVCVCMCKKVEHKTLVWWRQTIMNITRGMKNIKMLRITNCRTDITVIFRGTLGTLRGISKLLCIYSMISSATTNDVLRNPGWETLL